MPEMKEHRFFVSFGFVHYHWRKGAHSFVLELSVGRQHRLHIHLMYHSRRKPKVLFDAR